MKNKQPLNETNGSLFNKLFCTALVGENPFDIKFCGSFQQASALAEALLSSKGFQKEPGCLEADVNSMLEKLGDKLASAFNLKETFGASWSL
jgi:hypothetical protein